MLVGQRRVLMLDEINTGLDSATLFSVVSFLALVRQRHTFSHCACGPLIAVSSIIALA